MSVCVCVRNRHSLGGEEGLLYVFRYPNAERLIMERFRYRSRMHSSFEHGPWPIPMFMGKQKGRGRNASSVVRSAPEFFSFLTTALGLFALQQTPQILLCGSWP